MARFHNTRAIPPGHELDTDRSIGRLNPAARSPSAANSTCIIAIHQGRLAHGRAWKWCVRPLVGASAGAAAGPARRPGCDVTKRGLRPPRRPEARRTAMPDIRRATANTALVLNATYEP